MQRVGDVLRPMNLPKTPGEPALYPRERQASCRVCGDTGWYSLPALEPGHEMFGKALPCYQCDKGWSGMCNLARIPSGYRNAEETVRGWESLTAEQETAIALLGMVSSTPAGFLTASGDHGAILMGGTGTGKTTLAVACLQAARWVKDALYVYWPDLLSRIKASYSNAETETEAHIMHRVRAVQFLIVDDLGAGGEADTRLSLKIAEQIAENRTVDNDLWTIITTNLDNDGIAAHLSERVASRLTGRLACIPVTGPDMRGG